MEYVALACQATLAGVFLFSLVSKVRNRNAYEEFVASVVVLRLVPYRPSRVLALATVVAEAVSLVLLVIPFTTTIGFVSAAGLLAAFTTAVVIGVRRGTRTPCRCFGASSTPLGPPHIVRNALLLAGCGGGLWGSLANNASPQDPAWAVIALVAAAVALLFVLRLDDLVALFTKPAEALKN